MKTSLSLYSIHDRSWEVPMKRFVSGESRPQATLFPEFLDDFVSEDNPVRAIEAFVDVSLG